MFTHSILSVLNIKQTTCINLNCRSITLLIKEIILSSKLCILSLPLSKFAENNDLVIFNLGCTSQAIDLSNFWKYT